MAYALEAVGVTGRRAVDSGARQRRSRGAEVAIGDGVAILAALGGALMGRRCVTDTRPPADTRIVSRFQLSVAGTAPFNWFDRTLALSPDGRHLVASTAAFGGAYVDSGSLYIRGLDELEWTAIAGTSGARSPFFSSDGRWLGFWARGRIFKVAADGGAPIALCAARSLYGASWGSDQRIVFGQGPEGIFEVPAEGGEPRLIVAPDAAAGEVSLHGPQRLADGRTLLFTVLGAPVPLGDGVGRAFSFETGAGQFAVSERGMLVYLPAAAPRPRQVGWVDRAGSFEPLPMPERLYQHVRLSPDGRLVAADTVDDLDIWLHDIERDTTRRLTVEQTNLHPIWSADGTRIIFDSIQNAGLHWASVDGAERALLLRDPAHTMSAVSVTLDGKYLAFERSENYASFDIGILPLTGDRRMTLLLLSAFRESAPVFSPDGRWIAYVTDESGREEVYAQPFPGSGGRLLLSIQGGREPQWSPAGGELFYRTGSAMMAVPVRAEGDRLVAGRPQKLFDARSPASPSRRIRSTTWRGTAGAFSSPAASRRDRRPVPVRSGGQSGSARRHAGVKSSAVTAWRCPCSLQSGWVMDPGGNKLELWQPPEGRSECRDRSRCSTPDRPSRKLRRHIRFGDQRDARSRVRSRSSSWSGLRQTVGWMASQTHHDVMSSFAHTTSGPRGGHDGDSRSTEGRSEVARYRSAAA